MDKAGGCSTSSMSTPPLSSRSISAHVDLSSDSLRCTCATFESFRSSSMSMFPLPFVSIWWNRSRCGQNKTHQTNDGQFEDHRKSNQANNNDKTNNDQQRPRQGSVTVGGHLGDGFDRALHPLQRLRHPHLHHLHVLRRLLLRRPAPDSLAVVELVPASPGHSRSAHRLTQKTARLAC